ncbi:uncharacterized protein LOC107048382 [Diachasma alloeum]|uniref:uncharacterized protein LOC107048382 n=1 Tax=Diachasma alloeum TaxID=454923 RepID=UPI00073812A2|nr:uncharacterized protein LOC107048382 [Diachasma alloeum]
MKEFLITQFIKQTGRNQEKIKDVMRKTYPSQRMAILMRESQPIGELFNDWPFLRETVHFLDHASHLLGKESLYNEFLENVAKYFTIHDFMQYFVTGQMKKFKGKTTEKLTTIRQILKDSRDAVQSLNESFPQALSLIPLVLTYFDEENAIFQVVEKTTSDDDILNMVSIPTPLAIIKGDSVYSKDVSCLVLIEQRICFRCDKAVTAVLIAFLCYYVFGLKYPVKSAKTLEFMQRAFVGINTPGSKAVAGGKKRKRGVAGVKPCVMKLINTLTNYWTPNAE